MASNYFIYCAMGLSLFIPVAMTWKNGSFTRIVLITWLSVFVAAAFVDFVVPMIAKLLGEQSQYRRPDVPIVLPIAFGGWFYGLIVGGLIICFRRFWNRRRK